VRRITSPISELKEFFETFRKNPDIQYIDPKITPKMFRKTFSRVHEKKATSASGRHLGHYKALMDTDKLVDLLCKTMSLPWKHGICLDCWLKVIDVMSEKEEGIFRLHKLRIIQLIEADFNQCLFMLFTKTITQPMPMGATRPKLHIRRPIQNAVNGRRSHYEDEPVVDGDRLCRLL
jgi:hypothetical protein